MVSALLNDALNDPHSTIVSLKNELESQPSTLHFSSRVAQYFRDIFKHDDAFSQIPALNTTRNGFRKNQLVRFRAMVQDTSASPEVYPSLLHNGKPGGWGLAELAGGTADDDGMLDLQWHLSEREVVWAVSIPGESPFVTKLLDDAASGGKPATALRMQHKDPLMRNNHIGAQVKLYDPTSAPLKPAELYTFVGLANVEYLSSDMDSEHDTEILTLHTLFSIKHDPPLIPLTYLSPNHPISSSPSQTHSDPPAATLKDDLVQWVSDTALGGDRDAALWVLLVAISRVQSRLPPLFPLSLTLSRFPRSEGDVPVQSPRATPALTHVLRLLLPIFVDVPLTLSIINDRQFTPESRDESLHAGLLQLPAGTVVLLSDNGMQEGKITETGIKNIQALRNALTLQIIDYHFPFTSPYQFPTDLSFIHLTEGKKSPFVETLVNVPLECEHPRDCYRIPEDIQEPPPDRMDAFRRLLGSAKAGRVEITDELSRHIQDEFVRERQTDKTITPEDLMTRMSIARLLALLLHSPVMTKDIWREARELDQRRKDRFS